MKEKLCNCGMNAGFHSPQANCKRKYKVEFRQTETFEVDILAKDEEEAKEQARKKWRDIIEFGVAHYNQVGDMETEIGTIYDITNTDDPFNP